MSEDIRKMIDKVKKFKQFVNENIDDFKYIGYHSSNNPKLDKNIECVNLGKNDYYEWHGEILESIKEKYPEAEEYIKLNNNGDTGFRGDDTTKISKFISKIGICGVFVNEEKPDKRWGKYCYKVYFKKVEFERIHDFIMAEEGEEWCFLYLYKNSKPIFKKINSSLYEETQNEYTDKERIYLSQNGTDGFGYVMNIHLKNGGKKIGSIVFRQKTYLKDHGFPLVSELHIGFDKKYQRQGFFQESLIRLLDATDTPIYIASGRVINPDVFKAIDKIDYSLLNVEKIDIKVDIGTINGFIITKK
jgi:RimJ/RimL family protein N-acetyltransferase